MCLSTIFSTLSLNIATVYYTLNRVLTARQMSDGKQRRFSRIDGKLKGSARCPFCSRQKV